MGRPGAGCGWMGRDSPTSQPSGPVEGGFLG